MRNSYTTNAQTDLRQLTHQLIDNCLALATGNESFFINDVPENLHFASNAQMVAAILGGTLSSMARNSNKSCIRISAKAYNQVILVHMRDNNHGNSAPIGSFLLKMQ